MNNTFIERSDLLAASAAALLVAATTSSAQNLTLYSNDFTTRTSAGMIGNGTFSLNYTNGSLFNADINNPYAGQNMQDGWIKGKNGGWANLLVKTTNGNAYACICTTNSDSYTYGLQPIMNALSGGVVRVSCDLRPPRQWSSSSRNMAFYVGPDAFFTQAAEEYYKYCCPMAGIASSDGTDTNFKFRSHDGNGDGTHTGIYGTAAVDTTHWYRYVLDLTLSSNKYTAAIYDMGTDQPTLATATPGTPVETFGGRNFGFRMNLTPALGGITTLGLSAHGARGGDNGEIDIDLTARFDNVTLAFKPEGGAAFTGVYTNDFATRTYTRLGPGSTSYAYAVSGSEGDTMSYWQGNLVPNFTLEFPNGANGPVGQDGWARRNSGGAYIMVTNPTNPYARFHTVDGLNFGYAVQRIGNRLTNGTMRFSLDIRPQNAWYWFSLTKGILVNVGDNAYYNGEKYPADDGNSFYNHYATRFGFNGSTSSNDVRFVVFDGNGDNSATQVWGTAAVDTTHWYRFVADLDLTNSTVALNIYDLGSTQPAMATATPGTPVQTFSCGFRRRIGTGSTNLDGGITSLGLSAFGPRGGVDGTNAPAETALFDNLRVEARPAGYPTSTLIYANDFATRTFTNLDEYAVARLTGKTDMLTGGQDEWILRNNGTLPVRLSTLGGNTHFRASSTAANHSYSVQPLGTRVSANILCCQADMRPPRYWNDWYHNIGVYLGDDEFWQGNRGALRSFATRFAVQFGFGSASTGPDYLYNVFPDVSFLATDGTGAGAWTNKLIGGVVYTNWYRFKAEADLAANTYWVKVYNMGASQPTRATATPSQPVAVFENNRFTSDMRRAGDPDTKLNGISALGLAAFGVRGGGLYPANETALVDNLLLTVKPKGTLIRVF